jgi:hypothetical protein
VGTAIAIIKPKSGKLNQPVITVSFCTKDECKKQNIKTFKKYELNEDDTDNYKFQQIPFVTKSDPRNCLYLTARSGAGKSYYAKEWIDEFRKLHPKFEIYLFSSLANDSGSLDKIKGLHRVKLNKEFVNETFDVEQDFKDCLVIFDDVDDVKDKAVKAQLENIEHMILQNGRHTRTFFIRTSHMACNGAQTKRILNESHTVTLYPNAVGDKPLRYVLNGYVGMTNKEVDAIKKLGNNSRWITFYKLCPIVIMTENAIMLQSELLK